MKVSLLVQETGPYDRDISCGPVGFSIAAHCNIVFRCWTLNLVRTACSGMWSTMASGGVRGLHSCSVSWCKWANRLGHIFLSKSWDHFPDFMVPLPIRTAEDKRICNFCMKKHWGVIASHTCPACNPLYAQSGCVMWRSSGCMLHLRNSTNFAKILLYVVGRICNVSDQCTPYFKWSIETSLWLALFHICYKQESKKFLSGFAPDFPRTLLTFILGPFRIHQYLIRTIRHYIICATEKTSLNNWRMSHLCRSPFRTWKWFHDKLQVSH
jgi:hypothetical protein